MMSPTPVSASKDVDAHLAGFSDLLGARAGTVLNAVDEGIYCLDAAGNTSFVNEAAARLLGFTMREMVGRPAHELIHHHYANGSAFPRDACPIWGAVTDGIHQRVGNDVFWRKDGAPLPVDYTATPIREGRTVVAVVVTFRDVTAQQEARAQGERLAAERARREAAEAAERGLRERDARYQGLIAATGQIVWTNSVDGRMSGDQPGWSGYTGQSYAAYQDFGWADAVHPDDAVTTINAWNEAVAERRPFRFEHRVRGRDGQYRWFSIHAIPLLNDDGTIREWVGAHTDISEQRATEKQVERALAEAQHARAELQRVFEQAPAAIATLEGESLRFVTANPRFRTLLGNRDLIGKTAREALPELADAPFFALLDEVYRTGEPHVGRQVPAAIDRTGTGTLETGLYDFVYQPLRSSNGRVSGIMVHAVESIAPPAS